MESEIVDKYVAIIYEYFSKEQPDLIRIRDKSVIKWNNAWGEKFEKIPYEVKCSLVALIEHDGGQYRFK